MITGDHPARRARRATSRPACDAGSMTTLTPTANAAEEPRVPLHLRNDRGRVGEEATADLPAGGVASELAIDDLGIELPLTADDRVGPRNSFELVVATFDQQAAIVRYDVDVETSVATDVGGARIPAGPVFVVLDTGNPAGEPIADVPRPQRVPGDFHGSRIPDPE